ncbi:MAG: flagellar hook-basal body complex protein FliE [Chthoniobacter sp.]|nr:flagellar hook-basal body complex protein FliE [Chthoniobacter sp.]
MQIGSLPVFHPPPLRLDQLTRIGKEADGQIAGLPGAGGLALPTHTEAGTKSSFGNFLDQAVAEVDGKMHTAAAEQAKVLTGETNNLHQAMIAMQEASTAFSLMVEVRNKLVESYQEIMRMQV